MTEYQESLATLQEIKNAVEDAESQHRMAMNSAFMSKEEKRSQAVLTKI